VIKKEFLELLKRLQNERLLSSEAADIFRIAQGNRYSLKLNFIQFSSVLGRQINSDYNDGYKFECITEEGLDVLVLFQGEHKELVGSLSGQTSRETNVQVLGYDSLYQKPILGYVEEEITQQESDVEDDLEVEAEAEVEDEVQAKYNIKNILKSGTNHSTEDPKKVEGELKEGSTPKKLTASFQYIALDSKGEKKSGIKQGHSAAEVIQALRGEGLYPTQVVPEGHGPISATSPKKKSLSSFLYFIVPPIIGLIMLIASINEGGDLVILGVLSFFISIVLGFLFANVD
jgi:ABC-type Na+ efflux pump permease subunit